MSQHIGTLGEKSLHSMLKLLYAQPGDLMEHSVKGYIVDVVRPATGKTTLCIEIQTRSFADMKRKLLALLDDHQVHLVYPVAQERFIARLNDDGTARSRRKSPKRGSVFDLFQELVSFPALIKHPHLSVQVLLIKEEQIWIDNGEGSWRRRHWSIVDRRLLDVIQTISLETPEDFAALLPPELSPEFDCKDLSVCLGQPRRLAQKMAYCLREMGVLYITGKRGNAMVYRRVSV